MRSLYRPIRSPADLPREGLFDADARERHDLDFKEFASSNRIAEHGKDIAAFANTLGGVILVGAVEKDGVLTYPGVSMVHANPTIRQKPSEVVRYYEQATQTMCAPRPHVDPIIISRGDVSLVAINVEPFVGAIASKAYYEDSSHKLQTISGAWRFPYRVGSQTECFDPTELPMYMDPQVRRAIILLSQIPKNAILWVHYAHLSTTAFPTAGVMQVPEVLSGRLERLDEARNCVVLMLNQTSVPVPLRDVQNVWPHHGGFSEPVWNVAVAGTLVRAAPAHLPQATPMLSYRPLL